MLKFINSWAQGIILSVIIATIIEIILPEGNNKKYVKTVIGIYILFSIIYPLITKLSNKKIDFNSIINITNKEIAKYDNNDLNTIETNSYIEETYKNKIEEDIKNKLKEKGYIISTLNLYIETENIENYGRINSMVIKLEKESIEDNSDNLINNIEKIDINIANNKKEQEEVDTEISADEIKQVKEYLNNIYTVEIERIHINE